MLKNKLESTSSGSAQNIIIKLFPIAQENDNKEK